MRGVPRISVVLSDRINPDQTNHIQTLLRTALLFSITLTLLIVSSCATIKPEPFVQFRNSLHEAQGGIDAAMSINYNWTKAGFIDQFSSDPNAKLSQLILNFGEDYAYSWGINKNERPLYFQIKETKEALFALNNVFVNYADLLVRLTGEELISETAFNQSAKDLNANAIQASTVMTKEEPETGIAIFSAVSVELVRLYLDHKRQSFLKEAIESNQPYIQNYSDHCIDLIHTIMGTLKTYYSARISPIRKEWPTASLQARHTLTEDTLNLNESLINSFGVLRELEITYSNIGIAHADLAKAIDNPKLNLDGATKLYSSAMRLQRMYSELK